MKAAIDRIDDAEVGALNLLDENIQLYDDNRKKDKKILELTGSIRSIKAVLFVMGGILLAVAAYLIIRFILWIKGELVAKLG